jgi:hypothetical protein
MAHALDIGARMETEQLGFGARDGLGDLDAPIEAARDRLAPEGIEAIGAEGVTRAKTVAGECGTIIDAGAHPAIIGAG